MWTRQPGRNPKKIYFDKHRTVLAINEALRIIDAEAATNSSVMKDLKDKVFEALYALSWWGAKHPDWVDYPSHCSTGGGTHGLWWLIRREWAKQNPGKALDYEKGGKNVSRRPGRADAVWKVITNSAQARETMMITLDDNWSRSDHDIDAFVDLYGTVVADAIREAMVAGPMFHSMHRTLINSAIRISEKIQKSTVPSLRSVMGWQDDDDATDFLEKHSGLSGKPVRMVGRKLWVEYLDKVVTP